MRYATMTQIEHFMGSPTSAGGWASASERTVRFRVAQLRDAGLVETIRWRDGCGSVVVPTREGLRRAELDLSVPNFKEGTAEHELTVVSIGLLLARSLGGVILTDREIRASFSVKNRLTPEMLRASEVCGHDPMQRPRFAFYIGEPANLAGAHHAIMTGKRVAPHPSQPPTAPAPDRTDGFKTAWHTPDLLVVRSPRAHALDPAQPSSANVVVEVELTPKPAADYHRLFLSYVNEAFGGGRRATTIGGIGEVRYYCGSESIRKRVDRVAAEFRDVPIRTRLLRETELLGLPHLVRRADGRHKDAAEWTEERPGFG
jgi:hypothetical protein